MLNNPVNGKIQGLFKAFESFSSTFQGKFNFQGLFKTVMYIQVLFKPKGTLCTLPVSMQSQATIGPLAKCHWNGVFSGLLECAYWVLLICCLKKKQCAIV